MVTRATRKYVIHTYFGAMVTNFIHLLYVKNKKMSTKELKKMKKLKNMLKIIFGILILIVIGYFIFTVRQV